LGLDFGDKTMGVAVSSLNGTVAVGLTTLRRTAPEALRPNLKELKQIIREHKVTHILLGYPKYLHGEDSPRCLTTLAFKAKLERYFKSLPVILWDERLSTQAVARTFEGSADRYRQHVDEMAAVYILQGFLDSNKL
jgi:putative Holliday junction resolvase